MKTNFIKYILAGVLFFTLKLQISAATYNLTNTTGQISLEYFDYVNYIDNTYNISTNTLLPISIYLHINSEENYDKVEIYDVDISGNETLLDVISGGYFGTITTTSPSGNAKLRIITDGSCCYLENNEYDWFGFFIEYNVENSYTCTQNIINENNLSIVGNVGIGIKTPQEKLHINGAIRGNVGNTGSLRVKTTQGYIDIGPRITSYANFDTDQSRFLFNKPIYLQDGVLGAYSTNNLSLQTNGTTRMTIHSSNGNVGIGGVDLCAKLCVRQTVENYSYGIKLIGSTSTSTSGRIWMGAGKLHIDNSTAGSGTGFIFKGDGNVGLGVADPAVKLHIAGSIRGNSTNGSLKIQSNSGYVEIGPQNIYDAHINTDKGSFIFNRTIYTDTGVFGTLNSNNLIFNTNSTSTRMTILQSNGNVGIGTTSPDYKLDVAGVIRCSEVLVQDINQIADFVFKPDYSLPSLQQVDEFILSNGHLPGIPSEAEVKENGMGLVEMQIKLLQKVEELTLYVIEQDKRALEQEKRIKELEAELMNK